MSSFAGAMLISISFQFQYMLAEASTVGTFGCLLLWHISLQQMCTHIPSHPAMRKNATLLTLSLKIHIASIIENGLLLFCFSDQLLFFSHLNSSCSVETCHPPSSHTLLWVVISAAASAASSRDNDCMSIACLTLFLALQPQH